jgi:hypothetical protein
MNVDFGALADTVSKPWSLLRYGWCKKRVTTANEEILRRDLFT